MQGRSCANYGVALSGGFYKPPRGGHRTVIGAASPASRATPRGDPDSRRRCRPSLRPGRGQGRTPRIGDAYNCLELAIVVREQVREAPLGSYEAGRIHSSASGSRSANGGVSRAASWVSLAPRPWTLGARERSGRPRDPRHTEALVVPLVSNYRDAAGP